MIRLDEIDKILDPAAAHAKGGTEQPRPELGAGGCVHRLEHRRRSSGTNSRSSWSTISR